MKKHSPKQAGQKPEEATELKETLQRLQAEFENFRKRTERDNESFRKYANAVLVKSLLPVLDSFEVALKNTEDHEKFVKGVELVYAQLFQALEDNGLKPIKAVGEPLDPYRHEVLLQAESEKDGIVLEELQRGYTLNGMVLRNAKVKVGKMSGKNES